MRQHDVAYVQISDRWIRAGQRVAPLLPVHRISPGRLVRLDVGVCGPAHPARDACVGKLDRAIASGLARSLVDIDALRAKLGDVILQ